LKQDTAETETDVAEKSSWDQANRGEKLGLVWRNRKKISQIINDYLCLPFFLLIILWLAFIYSNGKFMSLSLDGTIG
jgi:hypothetical protein